MRKKGSFANMDADEKGKFGTFGYSEDTEQQKLGIGGRIQNGTEGVGLIR